MLANRSISPPAVCIIIHGLHIRRSLSFSLHRYESGRRVSAVCIFAFSLFVGPRFLFPLSFSLRVGASSNVHLVKESRGASKRRINWKSEYSNRVRTLTRHRSKCCLLCAISCTLLAGKVSLKEIQVPSLCRNESLIRADSRVTDVSTLLENLDVEFA